MADINERSLWRDNPYWASNPAFSNPYVQADNRADINDTHGVTQPPELNVGSAQASPVRPPGPTDSYPLPSRQPGVLPALGMPKSDVTFGLSNLVDQGIASMVKGVKSIGQQRTEEEWLAEMDRNGDTLGRVAVQNLKQQGIELTTANVNEEIQKLDQTFSMRHTGVPDEATPVGEDTLPDVNDGGIAGLDSGKQAANVSNEESMMGFLDSNKRPEESLEDFAKRIGVRLSDKPYSNWDYIRDMSAGLLASKEDNFFGALGDASLHSNANRDKADQSMDAKRTSLAVAKWQSDDDWEKLKLKQEAILKAAALKGKENLGKLGTAVHSFTDRNGTTTKLLPILQGIDYYPAERVTTWNGVPVLKVTEMDVNMGMDRLYKNTQELDNQIDDYMQTPEIDGQLKYVAENTQYQNEMLARWQDTDNFKDILSQIRESSVEGAQAYADALEEGDGQTAFQMANALAMQGAVGKTLKDELYTGLFAQLNPGELQELKDTVNKQARKSGRDKLQANPENPLRAIDLVKPAMSYTMKNMNWDEEGVLKFGIEYTSNELDKFRDSIEESAGVGWWNTLTGGQMFPKDHPLSKLDWEAPWNRPDENSVFTKSQWILLPEDQKRDVMDMGSKLSSSLQKDFNVNEKQANQDIITSLIDSNSVGGGEDMIGWNNQQSVLRKPKQWNVEPVVMADKKRVSTKQLREKGIMWNGFKGQFFTFSMQNGKNTRRNMSQELANSGYQFHGEEVISIE